MNDRSGKQMGKADKKKKKGWFAVHPSLLDPWLLIVIFYMGRAAIWEKWPSCILPPTCSYVVSIYARKYATDQRGLSYNSTVLCPDVDWNHIQCLEAISYQSLQTRDIFKMLGVFTITFLSVISIVQAHLYQLIRKVGNCIAPCSFSVMFSLKGRYIHIDMPFCLLLKHALP